ncbi:hypothetical protein ACHQM5_013376 [Ranunculus cassubicifolius]
MPLLYNFLFPPEKSIFITAMCIISPALGAISAYLEIIGNHMQYSKFGNTGSQSKKNEIKLSSRSGMLIAYTPAFLAGIFTLAIYSEDGPRFILVDLALTIHFFKRIFEVLYIHKFSGSMSLDSIIPISLGYFLSAVTTIYGQHLTHTLPEPPFDLKYVGAALFLLGIFGNLYHHTILAKLRKKDDKGYKIPKGGLFSSVICPHYLFEILGFIGVCLISQTVYPLCNTFSTILYLGARSYVTRKWYLSKFPDFPKDVKALIPYVF